VRSAALLSGGHLAVAWNEAMVFRGYGFETMRERLGKAKRWRCYSQVDLTAEVFAPTKAKTIEKPSGGVTIKLRTIATVWASRAN
jgi:hypothetical protein